LTDRPENLSVREGALHLIARREAPPLKCKNDKRFPDGRSYSSAFISTQNKKSWQAVRIEVRASLPLPAGRSKGLWPAMWLRPDDLGPGEIDILEGIGTGDAGKMPTLQQTIHFEKDGNAAKKSFVLPAGSGVDPTQVHTYAVTMYADRVDWSVDDQVTFSVGNDEVPGIAAFLDRRWFLRVNLAVGGRWPGDPSATTELPADMTVLDVRVLAQR
ncbi:MAG TPA: glycoside hydrolase family 16 protein, partial [Candidatus Nanopelagicales bacterium]|nr:glycoside hydrolase family 16 protein [Candidatus Nanopelagicales bacterium]